MVPFLYCILVISWFSVQESFSEIFGQMKQTVMAVGMLTEDPDFDLITEFKEDRVGNSNSTALHSVCGVCIQTLRYKDTDASNLEWILSSDERLQSLLQSIKVCLNVALARQNDSA